MRTALLVEAQQGLTYPELLAAARAAEAAGIETFFRSDHYASFPGRGGLLTTDAWTTLGGLARETARIGLGVLVSPVTFRIPGSLAKVVQTVDAMSGGRVELGLGAGWHEAEHAQLGIPYPPLRERVAMLAEELALLHGLWTEPDGWSFDGTRWPVRDARRHGPWTSTGRRPHVIVGGSGKPRLVALAARYADELNVVSASPEACARAFAALARACTAIDREPATVTRSAMTGVLLGRDAAEVAGRLGALREMLDLPAERFDAWLAERRPRWVIGTPDEARACVASFARTGVERMVLQDFLPRDLEHIRLIGEVFPRGAVLG